MKRYIEANLPANIRVRVQHLHEGNSNRRLRTLVARAHAIDAHKPRYATLAQLYDENGMLLSRGYAACSPKDAPCRSTGRAIAVGRAMKAAGL